MLKDKFLGVNLQLGLDLANTVQMHASEHPGETLHTYADLVAWAMKAGLLSSGEAERLFDTAQDQPAVAERVLGQARALRESIYRILVADSGGELPAQNDLAVLNSFLSIAMAGAQMVHTPEGFDWVWVDDGEALGGFLAPVARSVSALLTSELRERVGMCADEDGCGWLFIDTSKNRSRRWCDMGDCGNRAKQRRHYHRAQEQATTV